VSTQGADTPRNTSVPTTASANPHLMHHFPLGSRIQAVFVTLVSISFIGLSFSRPL